MKAKCPKCGLMVRMNMKDDMDDDGEDCNSDMKKKKVKDLLGMKK
jgi:hypothetical protein